ncbi:NmrA/HSCARG family protein [Phytohabitans kaempferiae]|uniref:NmrA/HSCARG family protein n=1 Tax=Phytohabitans kaempferiae TaxID=1620943 RepID=A0ABV6M0Z4_9ACTN
MTTPVERSTSSATAPNRADKPIVVIGATGQQGGATAARLLADGWPVRVLVRDPAAAAVRDLAAAGAEPLRGDFDDLDSLKAAMAGAHGVFAVTPNDLDSEREIRHGRHLADAAAGANVAHLVFSSVGGADRDTGISFWESKWAIERHIADLGLPATVLRPVRFMENHAIPMLGGISADGVLRHLFAPDVPVQLIAVTDIGAFAALAFADPDTYLGQAIELAGDELTPDATVRLISQRLGRQITYQQVATKEMNVDEDTARVYTSNGLWRADIPALRRRHPDLLNFPAWLDRGGADAIAALLAA